MLRPEVYLLCYDMRMERETLYSFFSGEATVVQEERVLDWLDADPANRECMLAERRLFDAMTMHANEAPGARRAGVLLRLVRRTAKYAAVVAATAGAVWLLVSRDGEVRPLMSSTVSVPAGQRVDVLLPDGTKVCMNSLSKLEYPPAFRGGERRVHLSGEAFFEVTHDEDAPFVVETFAGDVEVLGTKFDLEARRETDTFTASLIEGGIRVTDLHDPHNIVTLHPHQQLRGHGGEFTVSRIPEYEQFQWREGLLVFRDATFMEMIADFRLYYGVDIHVGEGMETPDAHFTGKIRISEGIDHALWVLGRGADFAYSRNEDKNIIYIH